MGRGDLVDPSRPQERSRAGLVTPRPGSGAFRDGSGAFMDGIGAFMDDSGAFLDGSIRRRTRAERPVRLTAPGGFKREIPDLLTLFARASGVPASRYPSVINGDFAPF
ncbi:hypothetical protein GCM10010230_22060 [Streptomyces narbonensis]|nr:hypothetical protein GCM10010230_22060 [Streptomyces narbonensis]